MSNSDLSSLVDLSFSETSKVMQDEHLSQEGKACGYYEVLGVDPRATRMEIREAYLKLKTTFAAESDATYSLFDRDGMMSQREQIDEAYATLSDERLRRDYDRECGVINGAITGLSRSFHGADPDESFKSELDPKQHLGTDRLLLARGEQAPVAAGDKTPRAPLPFIKLKASSAKDPLIQKAMAELQASHDLASGKLYRELRLLAQVSVPEICDRTKVCITYIEAIEADELGKLPQVVYVKGFLRSYFNYLGAPHSDEMVRLFAERLEDFKAQKKRDFAELKG